MIGSAGGPPPKQGSFTRGSVATVRVSPLLRFNARSTGFRSVK